MEAKEAFKISIKGRVQGVGFRPFIFRLANKLGVNGHVSNHIDGVIIHAESKNNSIGEFINQIKTQLPKAAIIESIDKLSVPTNNYQDFSIIRSSDKQKGYVSDICPDISICNSCLDDLYSNNRFKEYPLVNCTNCGPRFTIVKSFPYDRQNTSMQNFVMCETCNIEYNDIRNRRFHAQPISCPQCGPVYTYHSPQGAAKQNQAIDFLANDINNGKVCAIKSMGGYNLVCDSYNISAINKLREFKHRDKKPFAVMCKDINSAKEIQNTT